jgi:hypothetical protein
MSDGGEGGSEKTLPQSQVNEIVAREKAAAERAALAKVAEQLGCSVDEAKTRLADAQKAAADRMSEVERREEAAKTAEAAAVAAKAAAELLARDTRIERHLIRSGFTLPADPGAGAEAIRYGVRLLGGLPADADDTAIAAEITSLQSRLPGLFSGDSGAAGGGSTPPAPSAGGERPPARPQQPAGQWGAAGVAAARQRGFGVREAAGS